MGPETESLCPLLSWPLLPWPTLTWDHLQCSPPLGKGCSILLPTPWDDHQSGSFFFFPRRLEGSQDFCLPMGLPPSSSVQTSSPTTGPSS